MPVPKGTRIGGRAKGTPNKITFEMRESLRMLFENNRDNLDTWIKAEAETNPGKAAAILLGIYEHYVPKIARQEITGPDGSEPNISININRVVK